MRLQAKSLWAHDKICILDTTRCATVSQCSAGEVLRGDDAKLTIFFERAGKKRLIAKYAALEPA